MSDDALEKGRLLFAKECVFAAGADKVDRIPPAEHPEVAFAGRSNVGKSSLINAVTGQKSLARTSHTPGRTQQINFFTLGGVLSLADLPGYGYAKVSKTTVAGWQEMIKQYLKGRPSLKRVYVLIDSRRGLMPVDEEIMTLLDKSAVAYTVVLTKVDEIKSSELKACQESVEQGLKKHTAAFPHTLISSSRTGTGIPELRAHIAELLTPRSLED